MALVTDPITVTGYDDELYAYLPLPERVPLRWPAGAAQRGGRHAMLVRGWRRWSSPQPSQLRRVPSPKDLKLGRVRLDRKETSTMGPKPFKPSINWSAAPMDSLRWVAIAWVISAVCLFGVLLAFRYLTPWGRQFWRITRGYFVGRQSVRVWLMLGLLLLSVLLSVRLVVLLSYQGNDLYTAVQKAVQGVAADDDAVKQSGVHGFWMSIGVFSVLAILYVFRFMVDIYLTQRFIIAWRMWLTSHLTDDWLEGRAYYRDLFIDNTIDNPDQRIQQDIDIFTANAGATPNIPSNGTGSTLLFGAVNAVASVISFAAILWSLSGNLDIAEIGRAHV